MQQYVAKSSKTIVFLAHTKSSLNETTGVIERYVPVKGALASVGVESFFSCAIAAKRVPLTEVSKYSNPLLVITERDEMLGYKHVFQTSPTKATVGDRIRSPLDMWSIEETYIDNNLQYVLDRLKDYYAP